jgi:hypothetical protein
MNEIELLYGHGDHKEIPISEAPLNLENTSEIIIEDAQILYVLYEMKMSVAESIIPPSLHPSIPALFSLTFIQGKTTLMGAFTLAYTGIACRTGIKPRHLIMKAFCDNPQASSILQQRYGFSIFQAKVSCKETYDQVHGKIEENNVVIADISIGNCIPLVGAGSIIKYSPALNACLINDKPTLVQFEANYDFKSVIRGEPAEKIFNSKSLGHEGITTAYPVAGSHASVDLHLMPARFQVDLEKPAEKGGAQRIDR